jgi:hypothetical protein
MSAIDVRFRYPFSFFLHWLAVCLLGLQPHSRAVLSLRVDLHRRVSIQDIYLYTIEVHPCSSIGPDTYNLHMCGAACHSLSSQYPILRISAELQM